MWYRKNPVTQGILHQITWTLAVLRSGLTEMNKQTWPLRHGPHSVSGLKWERLSRDTNTWTFERGRACEQWGDVRKQRDRKAHVSLHSASMGLWHYQLELLAFLFLSWMQVQSAQGPLTSNALQSPQISHLNRTPCLPEVRHTHGEMKGFPGSPFPVRILGLRHQPASLIESPLSCALLQNCKN